MNPQNISAQSVVVGIVIVGALVIDVALVNLMWKEGKEAGDEKVRQTQAALDAVDDSGNAPDSGITPERTANIEVFHTCITACESMPYCKEVPMYHSKAECIVDQDYIVVCEDWKTLIRDADETACSECSVRCANKSRLTQ
jgi:hypothetical protein